MASPVCIPTNSARGFPFLRILTLTNLKEDIKSVTHTFSNIIKIYKSLLKIYSLSKLKLQGIENGNSSTIIKEDETRIRNLPQWYLQAQMASQVYLPQTIKETSSILLKWGGTSQLISWSQHCLDNKTWQRHYVTFLGFSLLICKTAGQVPNLIQDFIINFICSLSGNTFVSCHKLYSHVIHHYL